MKTPALAGLLLLCACAAPDPDTAAQQPKLSEAVASTRQTESVSATVGAAPIANQQTGDTSMGTDSIGKETPLRTSFGTCIAKSGGVTPDMQDCISIEADYQDGRLASAHEALAALLPPAERQALESEQNAWLEEREKACAWNAAEEGQGQLLDAEGCALEMTATRAAQLEARLQRR